MVTTFSFIAEDRGLVRKLRRANNNTKYSMNTKVNCVIEHGDIRKTYKAFGLRKLSRANFRWLSFLDNVDFN